MIGVSRRLSGFLDSFKKQTATNSGDRLSRVTERQCEDAGSLNKYKNIIPYAGAAMTFLIVVCVISYCLGADVNWDLRNYHFYNGYIWINGKFISDSLATVQSYLDPKLNSFYYILISSLSPLWVNLIIAALQSLSIFAAWSVSTFLFLELELRIRYLLSFILAIASISGPVYWSEIGSTMGDTLLAAPVVLSLLLSLYGYINKKMYMFGLSGFFVGVVCGLKLTNMIFLVSIAAAICVATTMDRRFSAIKVLMAIIYFCLAAVIGVFLLYYNVGIVLWEHYKNPLFPFFNNIFHSPDMANYAFHDKRWFPKTLSGYFFLLFEFCIRHSQKFLNSHHIGLEIPFRTILFAEIIVSMPVAAFVVISGDRSIFERRIFIFIGVFFIVSIFIWEAMFSYYRYAAVLEILAPMILAFLLYLIVGKTARMQNGAVLLGVVVLASSAVSFPHDTWGREPFKKTYFGIESTEFQRFSDAVVIVGSMPLGYVLPYFPKSDVFIGLPERIDRLTSVFQKKYLKPLDDKNKKILYLGSIGSVTKNAEYIGKKYQIMVDIKDCSYFRTNFNKLAICPAARKNGGIQAVDRK